MTLDLLAFKGWQLANYLMQAKGAQNLHSPFVYKLYTECIKNSKGFTYPVPPENYRETLLENDTTVPLIDFGAGRNGKTFKYRKVSSIASHSLQPKKYAQLLYRLVAYLQPTTIIELGTSLGVTTQYLSLAARSASIYTLEGDKSQAYLAETGFRKSGLSNISLIQGHIDQTLPSLLRSIEGYDMAFVDAHHTLSATLKNVNRLKDKLNDGGVIIMDDIYWSKGMKKAWDRLITYPMFSVSIDLHKVGLLFKRPGQEKQHFILKL